MTASESVPEIIPGVPVGLPTGLRNYWYPILQSEELPVGRAVGVRVLGEPLAVWRDAAGQPCVVMDRCPHRSIRLSVGRVFDGELQCVFHGLRFNGKGDCILIPWEESPEVQAKFGVQAYRAQELGGYVWAYIGDQKKFPPPRLEGEVPEELSKPDEFIWFRLPTQVWNTNWLLAVDGSDGFHAVVLHTDSQAASDVESRRAVPVKDRRVKIVQASYGIRGISVDLNGVPISQGHFLKDVRGDRFCLPCVTTNPIIPAPGEPPFGSRLWQFPIDDTHTMVVRFIAFRGRTDQERGCAKKVFNEVVTKRMEKVAEEDAWAAEAQGDLIEARIHERLLPPDADLVKVRRKITNAFVKQCTERRREAVSADALVFPV
jgi:phenylpropionate dioxygenase-like ring-hydroxylating dioxygenase large terminal subunit